jgi:hypothetical protein
VTLHLADGQTIRADVAEAPMVGRWAPADAVLFENDTAGLLFAPQDARA